MKVRDSEGPDKRLARSVYVRKEGPTWLAHFESVLNSNAGDLDGLLIDVGVEKCGNSFLVKSTGLLLWCVGGVFYGFAVTQMEYLGEFYAEFNGFDWLYAQNPCLHSTEL